MPCFLCQSPQANIATPNTRTFEVTCPDCGSYTITQEALQVLNSQSDRAFDLAFWVTQQNQARVVPRITQDIVGRVLSGGAPDTKQRAEMLLGYVIRKNKGKLKARVDFGDRKLQISCWCSSADDALALGEYLVELGALERPKDSVDLRLIAKGHIIYEEMAAARTSSSQAFVAMWFDPALTAAFDEGFEPAIRGAGYQAVRIDRTEHDGKIDDRIIAEIRRSAFVVADFTGHRGGVYYEAGFAHGLGKRVIFTCRGDHLENLHFDVRQYNTLVWPAPAGIVKPLQNRVLALFGAGPLNWDAKPLA